MAKSNFTEQLMAFLQQQPPEQVAQWLAHTISANKPLKKQWQVKLLLASGKPNDYKKLLTQALPKKELLDTPNLWRKVGVYFDDAQTLLALAFEQLEQPDCLLTNEQHFIWLMHAFERLNMVLETIDDSGGYRLYLTEQLSVRLIHSFHQLDWPQEQKVSWLREHQEKYDIFPDIPAQFKLSKQLSVAFSSPQGKQSMPENVSMALLDNIKGRQ